MNTNFHSTYSEDFTGDNLLIQQIQSLNEIPHPLGLIDAITYEQAVTTLIERKKEHFIKDLADSGIQIKPTKNDTLNRKLLSYSIIHSSSPLLSNLIRNGFDRLLSPTLIQEGLLILPKRCLKTYYNNMPGGETVDDKVINLFGKYLTLYQQNPQAVSQFVISPHQIKVGEPVIEHELPITLFCKTAYEDLQALYIDLNGLTLTWYAFECDSFIRKKMESIIQGRFNLSSSSLKLHSKQLKEELNLQFDETGLLGILSLFHHETPNHKLKEIFGIEGQMELEEEELELPDCTALTTHGSASVASSTAHNTQKNASGYQAGCCALL